MDTGLFWTELLYNYKQMEEFISADYEWLEGLERIRKEQLKEWKDTPIPELTRARLYFKFNKDLFHKILNYLDEKTEKNKFDDNCRIIFSECFSNIRKVVAIGNLVEDCILQRSVGLGIQKPLNTQKPILQSINTHKIYFAADALCNEIAKKMQPTLNNWGRFVVFTESPFFHLNASSRIIIFPKHAERRVRFWPIAAHELGHLFFRDLTQLKNSEEKGKELTQFQKKIIQTQEKFIESMNKIIEKQKISIPNPNNVFTHHFREFFSDITATIFCGPIYVYDAFSQLLNPTTKSSYVTNYPPSEIRARLILDTFKKMNFYKHPYYGYLDTGWTKLVPEVKIREYELDRELALYLFSYESEKIRDFFNKNLIDVLIKYLEVENKVVFYDEEWYDYIKNVYTRLDNKEFLSDVNSIDMFNALWYKIYSKGAKDSRITMPIILNLYKKHYE